MAYQPSISDLGSSANAPQSYTPSLSDLDVMSTVPTQAQQTTPSPGVQQSPSPPETNSVMGFIKKIMPKPDIPITWNLTTGLLSSFMPSPYKELMQRAPQDLTGLNYGLPQKIASGIGSSIPMLAAGGASLLGQAATGFGMGAAQAPPGQRLQAGAENALTNTFLGKVIPSIGKFTGNLLNPVTDKDLASSVQGIHDSINGQASQGFQDVGKGVTDRGISQVPMPLSVMSDLSNAIKSGYLPNKKSTNSMIDDALTGDYNALRKMQTELWNKGTKAASSNSVADNNMAEEIFDLRDRINGSISNHLLRTGNDDLNNTLNQARSNYKYLQDTFYNKNISPQIKKLVNPDIRQTPKNLGNLLQQDSIPMQNVRNAISKVPDNNWLGNYAPTYSRDIQNYNFQKGIGPVMKGLGYGGFGLGEAAALYKMFQNHSDNGH